MTQDFAIALLRTFLQMLGAFLASRGIVTESDATEIAGWIVSGVSLGWMLYARWNTKSVPKDAPQ